SASSGAASGGSSALAPQFAQQAARDHQVVVENPARDGEQVADERVAQRVPHREPLLARLDDVPVAQHGELLRDDRLSEGERLLQLLDGAAAAHEDLEDPDARGMGEGAEELRLERLQLSG